MMAAGSANEVVGSGRLLSDVRVAFRGDGEEGWILPVAASAALILHALLIVGAYEGWPDPPLPPSEIIAELVVEPPPVPDLLAAERTTPQPTPPPEAPQFRRSGDPERTQGGASKEPEPDLKPEPVAEEAVSELANIVAMTPPPTRKPSVPARASSTTRPDPTDDPGDGEDGGDPYLNQIRAYILKQHDYPAVFQPMRLSGVAYYRVAINRGGALLNTRLVRSTGVGALDDVGLKMIQRAAPFPPVPDDFGGDPVILNLRLYLGPDIR